MSSATPSSMAAPPHADASAASLRVAHLIGQYPAVNHQYLLEEIHELRAIGFDVRTASVSAPDRPTVQLSVAEREEERRTLYLKRIAPLSTLLTVLRGVARHPLRTLRALGWIVRTQLASPSMMLRWFAYLGEAIIVGEWMRRERIPHLHTSFSSAVGLLCARLYGVTMSFGVYGFGELHDPGRSRLSERIAASVMVRSNSKFGRNMLMLNSDRRHWEKLSYVALGIDPSRFPLRAPRPAGRPFVILTIGRLAPEKAQTLLVDAVARLKAEGRDVRLVLVGDGPDRTLIERVVRERALGDAVQLEGWVSNDSLRTLLAQADAFAMSSLYEGVPTVLIEAMSVGVPCVAPCIAGIPELIANERDGLLFAPADTSELHDALARLMDDEALRERIVVNARARVLREYDIFANSRRFGELLQPWATVRAADP